MDVTTRFTEDMDSTLTVKVEHKVINFYIDL